MASSWLHEGLEVSTPCGAEEGARRVMLTCTVHTGVLKGRGPGRVAKRRTPASRGPVANGPDLLNQ
jgi:hypothetical protein